MQRVAANIIMRRVIAAVRDNCNKSFDKLHIYVDVREQTSDPHTLTLMCRPSTFGCVIIVTREDII